MGNFGVWIGIFILSIACFIFWSSQPLQYYGEYGPGPGLFPTWLSGVLALLSILYIIDCLRKENRISFSNVIPKGKVLFRVLTVVASIVVFILIAPWTGYLIAGIIVTIIMLLPDFKWYSSLAISTIVTFALFFIFKTLLDIPLPVNAFGW
ncbi:tripartite tricarboxylate transporter TctB family protein [Pseudalkalibacillus decolorationis]|uniref:tripartite tricarboxylate transporter TctB family protein n=1 Tax=Pseudalkalibacillus decolorationis TaxID=163879 RepID=UPI00214987D4|nr:tripartite tricarboxylate transporter TctB family protein [Pseudalkalibacillus decolorationis]